MMENCYNHKNFYVVYDVIRGGGCPVCRAKANHHTVLTAHKRLEKQYDELEEAVVNCNNKSVKGKQK